jgi:DNA-binding response OmpR family regulator
VVNDGLAGRRVLVVEDELLVAMLIEDALADHDCVIVGPYARLQDALRAVRTESIDLAVLDVNLSGEEAYPVAELLAERGIPFLLLSGYGTGAIPANHPDWQACSKPFQAEELVDMLMKQLSPE